MIYFDYAATCPLDEDAAKTYIKAATDYFGNTNSLHDAGSSAKLLLEKVREEFSSLLGVSKDGLFFTSGGTESNYLAIFALLSNNRKGRHIISSMAEHSSIRGTLEKLSAQGYEITYLPLQKNGRINVNDFMDSLREDTVLCAIQYANPEIGSIQPIKEIGDICKKKGILFHSDCVHAFGKVDLKPIQPYVDSYSFSAHKFYGPKGVGGIYINPRIHWRSYYPHTSHENGFRPGTVNVPGIAAMLTAAEKSYRALSKFENHVQNLRNIFIKKLQTYEDQVVIYQLPKEMQILSTIGMRIKGKEGQWVMLECNQRGYCISTGSACQVGMTIPSATMKALGVPDKEAKEFIRISFGRDTTEEDVIALANALIDIIEK